MKLLIPIFLILFSITSKHSLSQTATDSLFVYPNPTTDILNIPLKGIKNYLITNLTGQICRSIKTESQTISLAGLPAGFYIISILDLDNRLLGRGKICKEGN